MAGWRSAAEALPEAMGLEDLKAKARDSAGDREVLDMLPTDDALLVATTDGLGVVTADEPTTWTPWPDVEVSRTQTAGYFVGDWAEGPLGASSLRVRCGDRTLRVAGTDEAGKSLEAFRALALTQGAQPV